MVYIVYLVFIMVFWMIYVYGIICLYDNMFMIKILFFILSYLFYDVCDIIGKKFRGGFKEFYLLDVCNYIYVD